MNLVYNSYATPHSAFFEGMVRVFDWGSLILSLRKKERRFQLDNNDPERRTRIVDHYVRDAMALFESEETERLSALPVMYRRAFATADIVLGSLPADKVLIQYENLVPGAVDRIMGRATEKLDQDSETELRYLENLCRQGFRGMVAGFLFMLLLGGIALLADLLRPHGARPDPGGRQPGHAGLTATLYVSKTPPAQG